MPQLQSEFSSSYLPDLLHWYEAMQPFLLCQVLGPSPALSKTCGLSRCAGQGRLKAASFLHPWMKTIASSGNWGKQDKWTNLEQYFFCYILIAFFSNQQLRGFQSGRSAAAFPNPILPIFLKTSKHLHTFYLPVLFICSNGFCGINTHYKAKRFFGSLYSKFIIWKQDIFLLAIT